MRLPIPFIHIADKASACAGRGEAQCYASQDKGLKEVLKSTLTTPACTNSSTSLADICMHDFVSALASFGTASAARGM